MSNLFSIAYSSTAGSLKNLAFVLAVGAGAVPASAATLGPNGPNSDDSILSHGQMFRGDSQTSRASDSTPSNSLAMHTAWVEVCTAMRLLDALHVEPGTFAREYLNQLKQIVDRVLANADQVDVLAGSIAVALATARYELLESVPTVRQWVGLARAIDPVANLRVPARFVRRAPTQDGPMNFDHLDAAVWVRSLSFT